MESNHHLRLVGPATCHWTTRAQIVVTVELGGIEPPSAKCHSAILPLKYSPDDLRRKGGESNSQCSSAAHTGSSRVDLPMCEPFHCGEDRSRTCSATICRTSGFQPGGP